MSIQPEDEFHEDVDEEMEAEAFEPVEIQDNPFAVDDYPEGDDA